MWNRKKYQKEQKDNNVGAIITYYQKKYDLQQTAICDGICSQATFTRLKKGERDVDFLVVETLFARVGLDSVQVELMLSEEDFELWRLRQEIKSEIWRKDIRAAEERVKQYEQHASQNAAAYAPILHEQFRRYYEAKLAELSGKSEETICNCAVAALALTRDVNAMPDIKKYLYTSMELELLLILVSRRHGAWETSEKAGECLKRIREYIDYYYPDEGMEEAKGDIWIELLKIKEQENEPEEVLLDVEKAIADLCRGTGILHLAQVRFFKAKLLEKIGATEACKEECKMAYCIFEVMGREEQVREIENFCQEKLGWHITI